MLLKIVSYILPFILMISTLYGLIVYSKVELPEIPPRPTLLELKKSLNSQKNETNHPQMIHINRANNLHEQFKQKGKIEKTK